MDSMDPMDESGGAAGGRWGSAGGGAGFPGGTGGGASALRTATTWAALGVCFVALSRPMWAPFFEPAGKPEPAMEAAFEAMRMRMEALSALGTRRVARELRGEPPVPPVPETTAEDVFSSPGLASRSLPLSAPSAAETRTSPTLSLAAHDATTSASRPRLDPFQGGISAFDPSKPPPDARAAARRALFAGEMGLAGDLFRSIEGLEQSLAGGELSDEEARVARAMLELHEGRGLGRDDLDVLSRELGPFFGRLAEAASLANTDPSGARAYRAGLEDEGYRFLRLVVGLAAAVVMVGIVGAILLVAFVRSGAAARTWRAPPAPGRVPAHLMLETFALYLVLFVSAMLLLPFVVRPRSGLEVLAINLVVQIALLGAIAWPAGASGRGAAAVRRRDVFSDLGFVRGEGPGREAPWGAAGYAAFVACAPILFAISALVRNAFGLDAVSGAHPAAVPMAGGASLPERVALLALAVVVAPVLEEIMFRGFFYRALRAGAGSGGAIAISAVFFAAVHPQGWIGFPLLVGVGAMLATLREWRGTIWAPIAAHMCVNGVTMAILAVLGA